MWLTTDMHKDGQTDWLVRLYEKTINGIRDVGLPAEVNNQILAVQIPLVADQADVMRYREPLPPGNNLPTGQIEFIGPESKEAPVSVIRKIFDT